MSKNPPHKWHFFFTNEALTQLKTMQRGHRMAVLRHLRQLVNADAPYDLDFAEALQGTKFAGIYKFRISNYRILFTLDTRPISHQKFAYKGTVIILQIGASKRYIPPIAKDFPMHRLNVLLLMLLLAACSAEPPITDVPFYTATPRALTSEDSQFAGADVPLEFIGGDPEILAVGGSFSYLVSGALISQAETGAIIYSYLPQFEAIPAHHQLYISASDADSSEQISFEFSDNLPVGQYPLIAPSDFIMGTVSAQYQRLTANDAGVALETYDQEVNGVLNLTLAGATISGDFQFTAAYIQRSPEGEVQTQRVEVTGTFADVPYREVGDDPFEVIVPLPTRIFSGTEAPVVTGQP